MRHALGVTSIKLTMWSSSYYWPLYSISDYHYDYIVYMNMLYREI